MRQAAKSILYLVLGAIPGIVLYLIMGLPGHLSVSVLGAFVMFALSFSSVSTDRVLKGALGAIVAKNAPQSMRKGLLDAIFSDGNEDDNTEYVYEPPEIEDPDRTFTATASTTMEIATPDDSLMSAESIDHPENKDS